MNCSGFCMDCPKKQHSLFKDLSFEELEIINSNKSQLQYKAGEVIFKSGTRPQGLFCLNEGKAKVIMIAENGTEQIISLKKPVDFIGFEDLMAGRNYMTSSVAIENSFICIIEKKDLIAVMKLNHEFALKIIEFLANNLIQSELRMVNLAQKHIRSRLADALLLVHDIFGTTLEDGSLDVSLKRSDLAGLANMTTANAIRILSAFSKEELIKVDHRRITLNNLEAMRKISLFDN